MTLAMSYTPLQLDIPPSPTLEDLLTTATSSSATAHSTQESHISSTSTRQARPIPSQNVFARLQALFPQASSSSLRNSSTGLPPPVQPRPSPPPPKFLKVRIMTWNMHDSLPKGELHELLGSVPNSDSNTSGEFPATMPIFTDEPGHFYHVIVVAGQECPSSSAIPKGISAGFRSRDRLKARNDDRDDAPKRWSHDEDREGLAVPESTTSASGWSLILEDWFCNGAGPGTAPSSTNASPRPPSVPPASLAPPAASLVSPLRTPSPQPPHRTFSSDDVFVEHRRKMGLESRKGPYELLAKERLMGIYIAVYVHRDVRPFVRGCSKGTVTAGLIGGRVGNKGGVGVSLKIEDTTLLFLNAHLAAHEGKLAVRLSNFAKIKAELSVDEFLSPDDPRVMQEDITDRFDHTFLCGDLNFRLDITRLHADWLISRKEYEQALAFDQLRKVMQDGEAFVGFKEGPIDFPPTFKYDVLRTLKRSKSRKEKEKAAHPFELSEVEEREAECQEDEDDSEGDGEGEGDATSVTSTAWPMSIRSKRTGGETEDEDYFHVPVHKSVGAGAAAHLVQKGVNKAKAKWVALLTPGAGVLPLDSASMRSTSLFSSASKRMSTLTLPPMSGRTAPSSPILPSMPGTPLPTMKPSKSTPVTSTSNGIRKTPSSRRPTSTKSGKGPEDSEDEDGMEKGVYDSSSKQRVPSWCDRILWKSTVTPEADVEDDELFTDGAGRPRTRVSQLLHHAMRPLRSRRESTSTLSSLDRDMGSASGRQSPTQPLATSPSEELTDPLPSSPFSRFAQHGSPKLTKSHSMDLIPLTTPHLGWRNPPPVLPRPSHNPDSNSSELRRSTTALPLVESSTIEPIVTTPRRPTSSRGRTISNSSISGPSTTPVGTTYHSTFNTHTPPSSRWRFLHFLSRNSSQTSVFPERPPTPDNAPPRRPQKGEIICLDYRTLDDRGMRRLEGRSDHRPVIGSYAIYV